MTLVGCGEKIFSDEPLGEIVALEPGEWDGRWLGEGGYLFFFQVLDAKNGVIKVLDAKNDVINDGGTSCKPGAGDTIQLRKAPVSLDSPVSGWYFPLGGSIDAQGTFVPGRAPTFFRFVDSSPFLYSGTWTRSGSALLLHNVAGGNRVESLVKKGVLPGRVENSDAILGRLTTDHYDVLYAYDNPVMNWRDPWFVFFKLPPELDPCKAKTPPK